ncbi:hypothetical protein L195_g047158, partial [Trifolium pratense]
RSVAHGAIEQELRAQGLCKLRHGATGLRRAQMEGNLEGSSLRPAPWRQGSCAWRN